MLQPCFSSVTQQKRKLRIYISNTYTPSKPEGEDSEKVASWELRVEGKLLEEVSEWDFNVSNYLIAFLVCPHFHSVSEKLVLLCSDLAQVLGSNLTTRCVHSSLHSTPQLLARIPTHVHTHTHMQIHTPLLF